MTSKILCIPPVQLEKPALLTMAAAAEGGLSDGPHNGPHYSEVAQVFFLLNKTSVLEMFV